MSSRPRDLFSQYVKFFPILQHSAVFLNVTFFFNCVTLSVRISVFECSARESFNRNVYIMISLGSLFTSLWVPGKIAEMTLTFCISVKCSTILLFVKITFYLILLFLCLRTKKQKEHCKLA